MLIKTSIIKGNLTQKDIYISRSAFVYHLGMAGAGFFPNIYNSFKSLGFLLAFLENIDILTFNYRNNFINTLYDPTELGLFSTLVGKAIGDYLIQKIDNCIFSICYEKYAKLSNIKLIGNRPDLIAFDGKNNLFSIECKGRKNKVDLNDDIVYSSKNQAIAGLTNLNLKGSAIASITHSIYSDLSNIYYDPPIEGNYDEKIIKSLIKEYYSALLESLKELSTEGEKYVKTNINGKEYYRFTIKYLRIKLCFLVDTDINKWIETGEKRYSDNIPIERNENIYISRSGVGLEIL